MKKVIHKFRLKDELDFEIEIDNYFSFLSLGLDPSGWPCFWAEVDIDAEKASKTFKLAMTGGVAPDSNDYAYLGTFIKQSLVFHLYIKHSK